MKEKKRYGDSADCKRLEEELRFKNALLDGAIDTIIVHDFEGNILYANRIAWESRGYKEAEFYSMTLYDLVAPEFRKYIEPRLGVLAETGHAEFETTHVRKDGSRMDIEVRSRVVDYMGQRVIVGVERDVTNRKRYEEELKARERQLRLFKRAVDEAPDGVHITDPEGRILYANAASERIYGFSCDELKEKHVNELNVDPRIANEVIIPCIKKTGGWTGELLIKCKDGRIVPIWLTSSLVKDETGTPIAMVGIIRDMTERKRSEKLSSALNRVNLAISSTLNFDEIMRRVVGEAARAMGCEAAAIELREESRWVFRYVYGLPERIVGKWLTDEEAPYGVLAAKTRELVVVNDTYHDERFNPEVARRFGIRSILAVPLIIRGEAIGNLCFQYRSAPIAFDELQIDFAKKLMTSVSLSLENARLYGIERRIATTLQQSLIRPVPRIPGVEIGVVYASTFEAELIGGDFYDVFELDEGLFAVLIGDVAGKGVVVAGITDMVWCSVRTLSYIDPSPPFVFVWSNVSLLRQLPYGMLTTAAYLVIDIRSGEVRYASAGHPPAIVCGETCEFVSAVQGLPLGTFEWVYRGTYLDLEKGETLILYTDGLTEARKERELYGEDRLLRELGEIRMATPQEIADLLLGSVKGFTGDRLTDDIAILVLRLSA